MPKRKTGAADGGDSLSSGPGGPDRGPLNGAEDRTWGEDRLVSPASSDAEPSPLGEPLPPEPPAEPESILPADAAAPHEPAALPETEVDRVLADDPDPRAEDSRTDATAGTWQPPSSREPESAAPLIEPEPVIEPAPAAVAGSTAAHSHDEVHDEHEEETGPSLAGRALTLLLVLIAGAALGIWAAPKVAPMLPSGMAPVATWLTPGRSDAEARIAALEERVGTSLASVESRLAEVPAAADLDARIASAVTAAEGRLEAEVAAVRQALDQGDAAQAAQRLARVESTIDGQTAELETLKQQIAGAADAGGSLSAEALSQIDVYRGEVDGLRAEMGAVQDKVAALATRLEEVSAEARRQIETAQARVSEVETQAATELSAAQVAADLAQIRAALASGQPFGEPLGRLQGQPGVTVPEGLADSADSGVATLAALRDDYPDAAHAAIRASIFESAGDGVMARSRAFLQSQVASRSLSPQEGEGTDAVLSRIEDRVRNDDLDGALAAAEALPSEAAAAMQDWLDAVRKRAQAVDGLGTLESSLTATN